MKLIVKKSRIHGSGCYAARDFEEGEVVGEYTGTLRHIDDAEELEGLTYLFTIDEERVIDATRSRNPAKYINHSCEPNCESEQDEERIFIRAIRPIKKGEEVTYDYNLDSEDEEPCSCGAPTCRGTMRGED